MNSTDPTVLWVLLVILLILSAFFSGSETGMMALNRYRLKHQQKKSSGARRAAKLLKRPDRLIGLILIGNNAVNILAAIIANMLAIIYVGEAAAPWGCNRLINYFSLSFFRSNAEDNSCAKSRMVCIQGESRFTSVDATYGSTNYLSKQVH